MFDEIMRRVADQVAERIVSALDRPTPSARGDREVIAARKEALLKILAQRRR